MNRALREQIYQDDTIPKTADRPSLTGTVMAGRCSLEEVSTGWDFTSESLSGQCLSGSSLSGSGCRAEIKGLISLLIAADDKIDLVECQTVVGFGVSSAFYANQIDNKQSNLNGNGGLFGHPLMEVLS